MHAAGPRSRDDDLRVSLDGPEPPIMDGSGGPFFEALAGVGITEQPGCGRTAVLRKPVSMTDGESTHEAVPADPLELDLSIDFQHPLLRSPRYSAAITRDTFRRQLAFARTFGFLPEVD